MEGQLWRSKWLLMEGKGEKCVMFSPSLHAAAEAFWFKRINGSAQGYFSLTGAVQNNTPSPYFLEEPYALRPLFLLPPFSLTIGEVIRHECLGLQHEWMSSCNAPMTFCHSLLDLLKRRKRDERTRKKVKETAGGREKKKEASSEIFRDIQFTDRDVLLSASSYPEQMLNGLIDRKS